MVSDEAVRCRQRDDPGYLVDKTKLQYPGSAIGIAKPAPEPVQHRRKPRMHIVAIEGIRSLNRRWGLNLQGVGAAFTTTANADNR